MAGERQGGVWPLPKIYFAVDFGDGPVPFQEVSGLNTEARPIEYRRGDNPDFAPIKMPGLGKVGNVTLKKGVFKPDGRFWDWVEAIKMNTIQRRQIVISLIGERGAAMMKWTLSNAWPTKLDGTDLRSGGNEVAVETIELAFETVAMTAP